MTSSTENIESIRLNSTDPTPSRVKFQEDHQTSPRRQTTSSITQDDSSLTSRQGLFS